MTPEELIARHPRLFHMAEVGSWPKVQRDGLLSTSALLDLYEINGDERERIELARRPKMVTITHPRTGETAVIRDNIPLNERFLATALTDMTPREWYHHLNRRVFFWVREQKLNDLLSARAYRGRQHEVITVDTRALVERDLERISLAPINTGAAFAPNAARRGSATFARIADYPFQEHLRWRGAKDVITELAVDYRVADIQDVALRVERRHQAEILDVLWSR
jgi:hypothetical protein